MNINGAIDFRDPKIKRRTQWLHAATFWVMKKNINFFDRIVTNITPVRGLRFHTTWSPFLIPWQRNWLTKLIMLDPSSMKTWVWSFFHENQELGISFMYGPTTWIWTRLEKYFNRGWNWFFFYIGERLLHGVGPFFHA